MTSTRIQLYLDKENSSQLGVVSRGKSALSTGVTVGKTFVNNTSGKSLQTPRRALGDVNDRDVSQPLAHKHDKENNAMKKKHQSSQQLKHSGFGNKKDGSSINMKKPVLQMRPPVPASKPVSSRGNIKNEGPTRKKQAKAMSSVLKNTNTFVKPLIVDEVETMHIYQDSEEEYEEVVFPKHERPSTFLYRLGHWQPSLVIEDTDEDDTDSTSDSASLSDINPELLRPPQLHNSLVEETAVEMALEPEPTDVELVSIDELDLLPLEMLDCAM